MRLDERQLSKKALYVTRILNAVNEFYAATGQPMPMKSLSGKFSKALSQAGGFPETVSELQLDGALEVVMHTRTGGKAVFPEGQCLRLPLEYVLLKRNG